MKNIIVIIVLFAMTACLYSQTEPTQATFTGITGGYINAEDNQFIQGKIQTGFIWSSDVRMNEVLGVNSFWSHNYYYDDIQGRNYYYLPEYFKKNSDLIMQLWGISSCSEFTPMNNISFQYEPTLKIDNVGVFKSRSNEPTKSVFGFRNYRNDVLIGDNDTELNLDREINYDDIEDENTRELPVISEPWPSTEYDRWRYAIDGSITDYHSRTISLPDESNCLTPQTTLLNTDVFSYNGAEMFVTIRLHRTELIPIQGDVLEIRLPYTYKDNNNQDGSGFIKFSALPLCIPEGLAQIVSSYNSEYRGLTWLLGPLIVPPTPKPTEIVITTAMLPDNGDYITISGYFECKNIDGNNYPNIKSIGIDVKYLGNCDIGIDWIRIETRDAQRLYRGFYDMYLHRHMQCAITQFTSSMYTVEPIDDPEEPPNNLRFFRVYLKDEAIKQEWGVTRYFNKFVGNIGVTQTGSEYSKFYTYYTESPQMWTEEGAANRQTTCPYVRRGSEETNSQTMLLKLGFDYPNSANITADSLNSSWEFYPYKDDYTGSYSDIRTCDLDDYYTLSGSYLKSFNTSQIYFEKLLYEQFYNYDKDFNLYGPGYFWYQNLTPVVEIYHDSPNNNHRLSFQYHRPFTGEELRLSMWTPIILGAKGLIYDGVGSEFAFSGEKK